MKLEKKYDLYDIIQMELLGAFACIMGLYVARFILNNDLSPRMQIILAFFILAMVILLGLLKMVFSDPVVEDKKNLPLVEQNENVPVVEQSNVGEKKNV